MALTFPVNIIDSLENGNKTPRRRAVGYQKPTTQANIATSGVKLTRK